MSDHGHYYGVRPRRDLHGLMLSLVTVLVVWGGAVVAIAWRVLTEGGLP